MNSKELTITWSPQNFSLEHDNYSKKLHQQGFNKIKNSPQLLFAICLKCIQSKKTKDQLARLNPLVQQSSADLTITDII